MPETKGTSKFMETWFSESGFDYTMRAGIHYYNHPKHNIGIANWEFRFYNNETREFIWQGTLQELVEMLQLAMVAKQDFIEKMLHLKNRRDSEKEQAHKA